MVTRHDADGGERRDQSAAMDPSLLSPADASREHLLSLALACRRRPHLHRILLSSQQTNSPFAEIAALGEDELLLVMHAAAALLAAAPMAARSMLKPPSCCRCCSTRHPNFEALPHARRPPRPVAGWTSRGARRSLAGVRLTPARPSIGQIKFADSASLDALAASGDELRCTSHSATAASPPPHRALCASRTASAC